MSDVSDEKMDVDGVRAALGIGSRYATVATFAAATGVSVRTVNVMFERGILTRKRLAATVYVDLEEAAAALAAGSYSPRSGEVRQPVPRRPGRPVGSTKAATSAQREAAEAVRNRSAP